MDDFGVARSKLYVLSPLYGVYGKKIPRAKLLALAGEFKTRLSSPAERDLLAHGTRILVGILTFLTFLTFVGWWLKTAGAPIGIKLVLFFSFFVCFRFPLHLANGPVVHVSSVWDLSLRCLCWIATQGMMQRKEVSFSLCIRPDQVSFLMTLRQFCVSRRGWCDGQVDCDEIRQTVRGERGQRVLQTQTLNDGIIPL